MQNVIFLLFFFLGFLHADTIGMPEKSWVSVPELGSSTSVDELEIGEEYVVPNNSSKSDSVAFFTLANSEKYRNIFLDFINPLWFFIRDNTVLLGTFLAFYTGLLYLFFYQPLTKRIRHGDEEDIIIPQAFIEKERVKTPLTSDSSLLTQSQYSTLYGLMNESFIYEKERILLDKSIKQDERNREVISLEWKFNQILHFALPKLSGHDVKRFKEGVKELLDEDVSRDIMIAALEDILQEDKLQSTDKLAIQQMLVAFTRKERRENAPQVKEINYTNYMGQ